jgi:hypothetical protein
MLNMPPRLTARVPVLSPILQGDCYEDRHLLFSERVR